MFCWLKRILTRLITKKDLAWLKGYNIHDVYARARKGNMTPEETYKAFDYDDDKSWLWEEKEK